MCSLAIRAAGTAWALVTSVLFAPTVAHGQTDYVNTDLNRPLRVHDALAMERHAFELHLAPWSLLSRRGVADEYSVETELAWGVWRRTQVELGAPVTVSRKANGSRGAALSGVDVRIMHQLNTETLGLPALAIGGDLDIPVRGDGSARFTATVAATDNGARPHAPERALHDGTGAQRQ